MAKGKMKKPTEAKAPVAGRVVEAAMASGAGGGLGAGLTGREIEQAMNEATNKALKAGVTDPGEVLKLKLAAREDLKAAHRKAAEKASKG